jgi:predicted metalloprotease
MFGFNNGGPRPPTAATNNFIGGTNFNRARTAAVPSSNQMMMNPRIKRYEEVIIRLKRLLGQEKRTLRRVRTVCAREIEIKGALEKILRACVDDVKNEIAKKRQ